MNSMHPAAVGERDVSHGLARIAPGRVTVKSDPYPPSTLDEAHTEAQVLLKQATKGRPAKNSGRSACDATSRNEWDFASLQLMKDRRL